MSSDMLTSQIRLKKKTNVNSEPCSGCIGSEECKKLLQLSQSVCG